MTSPLADAESRRWFWRPALVAAVGALAIGVAIGLNFWQTTDTEQPPSSSQSAERSVASIPPAGVVAPTQPSFDVVRINPNGDTVIAGRAEPGAIVVLRDGEAVLGTVTADGRGEWVLLPETPLSPGAHRLNLLMNDGSGGQVASAQDVLVVVPEAGEDVAGRPGDASAQPLVLRIPRDGGPATVLQKPLSGVAEAPLAIDSVDWQDGRIVIDGHAPAQTRVRLLVDGRNAGETVADANGRWRIQPTFDLGGGNRTVTLEQLDSRGSAVARMSVPLALQDVASLISSQEQSGDQVLVVQPGANLWRIARSAYGRGTAYTIIYQANRAQIADPDWIYPGQVFRVPGPLAGQTAN
jgi:nucleoid-associated protein YgaU